jgi:hypothetical protein
MGQGGGGSAKPECPLLAKVYLKTRKNTAHIKDFMIEKKFAQEM